MSLRIKKNDSVVVITGPSKGKRGKVLRVNVENMRVTVEGVNLRKRFIKKTRKSPQGGLVEEAASMAISNLALWCGSCSKPARFRTNTSKDGSKSRVCARCESIIG